MNFQFTVVLLVGVLTLMSACTTPPPERSKVMRFDYDKPWLPQLKAVDASDGISAGEADLLSTVYFIKYEGQCGGSDPVFRRRGQWIAETLVGPSGVPGKDIHVDANSGEIRQRGNPVSRPPWDDLREFIEMVQSRLNDMSRP